MAKKVQVDIKTKGAGKASKDLGKVDKGLGKLAKSAASVAAGFFAVQGLINGFQAVINATREQELAERQLNAVLKSTGQVAGLTARELTGMASALQKQTRFGDEAIIKAQSLMLTFTKVGKDVFPDAIETVLNMSEAMGQDLQQGVIQVGKALNDPILGVTALRRVGVQLSKQQEQQVKDFVAVNDIAAAQKIILGELETQFGGVAKAAGQTMAGQLDQMSNAVGDAAESIGTLLAPAVISIAEHLVTASESAGNFFRQFTDTSANETIDKLAALNLETTNLEKAQLKKQIADNKVLLSQKNLTASAESQKQTQIELESATRSTALMTEQLAKVEEKALASGIDLNEAMNDLYIETGIDVASNLTVLTRLIREATNEQDEHTLSLLGARQAVLNEIESRKLQEAQLTENLELIADTIKKQKELDNLEKGPPPPPPPPRPIISLLPDEDDMAEDLEVVDNFYQHMKDEEESFTEFQKEQAKTRKIIDDQLYKEKIQNNLQAAILQGQSAKQAGISVIKAEVAEAQAGLISSIMKSLPFPINLAVAAGAGGMIGKVTDQLFSSFATGGSFVTKGRTTLPIGNGVVVGDNASGMERIDVTPLPSPTSNGNNITINISAPLVDETVVDHIIPAIRRAEKLNL